GGVDEEARSIKQFIKRYVTAFNRWNSPKFLLGESYGTPRTCVLTWLLHEDGVDLKGVVLLSSVLDYSQIRKPVGLLPTLAAIALYHGKVTLTPRPPDLPTFMIDVEKFARGPFATAIKAFPKVDRDVLKYLTDILGIPPDVLRYWSLDPSIGEGVVFLRSLLLFQDEGFALGGFDGRVCAKNTGIAASIGPGHNDPAMTAVGGVYTAMWNAYLN